MRARELDLADSEVLVEDDLYVTRIYNSGGQHPGAWDSFRTFGPLKTMRLDPPQEPQGAHPGHGVMYGAINVALGGSRCGDPLETAVLERFLEGGTIDRDTNSPWLAVWRPTRPLSLLALSGSRWVARASGNAALTSGPRGIARQWAAAVHSRYPDIDGLTWSSSVFPPGRCLVLFETARAAVPGRPATHIPFTHRELQPALARIAGRYRLVLL